LDIRKETEFCLTIKHDKNTVLIYKKLGREESSEEE